MLNGILNLTSKEAEILTEFIDAYWGLKSRGLDIYVFSPAVKKIIAKKLGMSNPHSLNIYIKTMKDKSVLKKVGKKYEITPVALSRDNEIIMEFV